MSVDSYQRDVSQYLRDIVDLEKKVSEQDKKLANLMSKRAALQSSMSGRFSPSSLNSKARELDRLNTDAAKVQRSRADITSRIASKRADLARAQERLSRAESDHRKRLANRTNVSR